MNQPLPKVNKNHSSKVTLTLFLLFSILLFGTVLRLYHLHQESLWTDEAFTVHHAQLQDWGQFIQRISTTEGAPPGHYLLLHYWMQWFGNSEFSVRFPSVIFGILSIIILFLIVRRLWNEQIALLASLFMSTSMLQILFSQEARLYSLFTFLVLLSAYFFMKIILDEGNMRDERKKVLFLAYLVTMATALVVNYLALVMMAIYSVLFLFYIKNKKISPLWWKKWVLAQGILLVGISFLLWPIFQSQFSTLNTGLRDVLISKSLPSVLASLGLFFYALPVLAFVLFLFLVLWGRKVVSHVLTHSCFDAFFSLLVITAGSIYLYFSFFPVTLLTIPITRYPITHSYFLIRHSFFLAPLWYVFLAWKISSLRWKKVAAVMTVVVLLVSTTALYEYYHLSTKPEWREAAQFIASQNQQSSAATFPLTPLILLDKSGLSNEFLLDYYFPQEYRLLKLTFSEQPRQFAQLSDQDVFSRLTGETEFWLILARNTKTGNYYRDLLDRRYQRDISREFYQVKVYRYSK